MTYNVIGAWDVKPYSADEYRQLLQSAGRPRKSVLPKLKLKLVQKVTTRP